MYIHLFLYILNQGDRNDGIDFVPGFFIPQRYVLGIMGFLAVVNAYNMRVCLSVAINVMAVPIKDNNSRPDSCPVEETVTDEPHHNTVMKFASIVNYLCLKVTSF